MNHKKVILLRKRKLKFLVCLLCEDTCLCLNEKADAYITNAINHRKEDVSPVSLGSCMSTVVLSGIETEKTLKKITKNQMVLSGYSVGWQRLISQHVCLTSWFRILIMVFTLSTTTSCYNFMRNLLRLYVSEYAIILATFKKVFATQYFNSLCLHKSVWKISQVSNITYLH